MSIVPNITEYNSVAGYLIKSNKYHLFYVSLQNVNDYFFQIKSM